MPNCSIFRCHNRSQTCSLQKNNITFHLFPKYAMIRDAWVRACANHITWTPKRTSTVCSYHFEPSCFILQANNKRRLKQSAVPTLHLFEVDSESQPETSISEGNVKLEDPLSLETQSKTDDGSKTAQSENYICTKCGCEPFDMLKDTPRILKFKWQLKMKNVKIKRLQAQTRFLKTKIEKQQELLRKLSEKIFG